MGSFNDMLGQRLLDAAVRQDPSLNHEQRHQLSYFLLNASDSVAARVLLGLAEGLTASEAVNVVELEDLLGDHGTADPAAR
jgi:hypothetical protein